MRSLVLALTLVSTSALAFPGPPGPPDMASRVDRMVTHLGLDTEQADRLTDVLEASQDDGEALRQQHMTALEALRQAQSDGDEVAMLAALAEVDAARANAESHREATHTAVLAVLTIPQQAQLVLAQHARQGQRGEPLRDGGGRVDSDTTRVRRSRRSSTTDGALQGL